MSRLAPIDEIIVKNPIHRTISKRSEEGKLASNYDIPRKSEQVRSGHSQARFTQVHSMANLKVIDNSSTLEPLVSATSNHSMLSLKLHPMAGQSVGRAVENPYEVASQSSSKYQLKKNNLNTASSESILPNIRNQKSQQGTPMQDALFQRRKRTSIINSSILSSQERLNSFDQKRSQSNARLKSILQNQDVVIPDVVSDEISIGSGLASFNESTMADKKQLSTISPPVVKRNGRTYRSGLDSGRRVNRLSTEPDERQPTNHASPPRMNGVGTRKGVNRRMQQAKKDAERSAVAVQSRIKLLGSEDKRMQKKIEQTQRMMEKISNAQELQEKKFDLMMKLDRDRSEEKKQNELKVDEERIRHKVAMEDAKKKVMTSMLEQSLAAKEEKVRSLQLAMQKREQDELNKLQQADYVREMKIKGLENREKNSRFTHLGEIIAQQQAEEAAQAEQDLMKVTEKFKLLEKEEYGAIEKLKMTQSTQQSAMLDLERAMQVNADNLAQRKLYRQRRMEEQRKNLPKVVKKVQMIDPASQQTWNTSHLTNKGGPNVSSPTSDHSLSSGKLSMGSQDAIIEQLRQQHKKIVAEGRQRLVGNLMKQSVREVQSQVKYPFQKGNGADREVADRHALRTINQLKDADRKVTSLSLHSN